jgi:hypothetical protein
LCLCDLTNEPEINMTRFFFDVKSPATIEHDFNGRCFSSLDEAKQMGELVAMDLGCTRVDGSFAIEVQIRDPQGTLLCAVPVASADALAA